MAILLVLFYLFLANPINVSAQKTDSFTPKDNFLIDCGATSRTTLADKRVFLPDQETGNLLSSKGRDIQVSAPSANNNTNILPIYLSARIFVDEATYTFHIDSAGWHWIRLHFFPLANNEFNLQQAKFKVVTDQYVLIYDFQVNDTTSTVVKEYLVNVTTERFEIKFVPEKSSAAFINAIELVSAPNMLVEDVGSNLFPVQQFSRLSQMAYKTIYRLNVGGPVITSQNDTLGRTWFSDQPYMKQPSAGKNVSVPPNVISYPDGESPLIAPPSVYASAVEMADATVAAPNFNVSWSLDIDTSYSYLVRLHFCDIVSKSPNDLYFNVYINGKMGISGLDLSTVATGLANAYYKDFVVNSSILSNPLTIQIGPMNEDTGTKNAILNGLEVLRMNNSVGSLDGEYGVDGRKDSNPSRGTVAAVGFAMMFGAFVGLGAMAVKWQKRPQDWQKRNSFSSWLLPLHAGDASFLSSSKTSLGSRKSQFYSSTMGLGRYFNFAELQDATNNWDPSAIIGVGGFGNVYLAEIDDGTKVAVKREWAMQWKRKGLLDKIIDPTLVNHINPESMKKFAEAAEKCLAEYGVDRPTMGDVLWNLEYALQLQEASSQGKVEEENRAVPASPGVVAPASAPTPTPPAVASDNKPVSSPEENKNTAEVQVIDEHSGTAMFAQFAALNGR
ncbi:hypothetical protein ACH5RR_002365 [Cinchona calisaya]|uniref:Malectin-like domain-containing protein n=1 Tax=Cinchona calisaya TaxID=153742 RepID=A0ABD3B7E0_9GENT